MKRPLLIAALMAMSLLLWQQPAKAQTTHYVDNVRACAGLTPCYSTVMEAVSAAVPFDSIEVFPGVYHDAVVLDGTNNVVFKAHIEALMPVIEAPSGNSAVSIRVSSGVQVLNFVLEASEGAGVAMSPTSSDVLVQGNVIRSQRGIVIIGRSGRVIHNTAQGGGIFIGGSGCVIARNTVSDGAIELMTTTGAQLSDCVIRHNIVRNGGISLRADSASNTIESNVVDGGSITISGGGAEPATDNVVRRNVVRRAPASTSSPGGITLRGSGPNTIEANFVSGSAEDGIFVQTIRGGASIIRKNTSVENAGCDINDASPAGRTNVWQKNRFGTKCGSAAD